MKNDEKKQQPQHQVRNERFAQDGLDTSKARQLLQEISKQQTQKNKEGK